jgi:DNA (cytosine-5)-methyltransferase 1
VREQVLDARDFGSLEARVRWFLIAHPPEIELDDVAGATSDRAPALGQLLDPVPLDDESYREVEYLVAKQDRDAAKGDGFRMQWLTEESTSVPTLRRGYSKGGSTDPRLLHSRNASLSRLLTAREHARIKGILEALIEGGSATLAHQVCGQSVDTRPVRALGRQLGEALRRSAVGAKPRCQKSVPGPSRPPKVAA